MAVFEIASNNSDLGAYHIAPENVEKHRADMAAMLGEGIILTGVTATVTSGATIATAAGLSSDGKSAIWYVHAADFEEDANFLLTVGTNDGQTLNFSLLYVVG